MPLTYCGIALGVLPDDVDEFVGHWHSWSDWTPAYLSTNPIGLDHLPLPYLPDEPVPEVGVLRWPSDMSRPAMGCFVVDSVNLALIRTAIDASDFGYGPLVMTDDINGKSRTFNLFPVAIRPVFQIEDQTQLYQILVADGRYYYRQFTDTIDPVPVSWSAFFSGFEPAFGITLTPASVDADYDVPTDRWLMYERPLSPVADAVAAVVGHRIVANLNGTFKTVTATGAKAASDAQYALLSHTCGGQYVAGDLCRAVPAEIKVLFAQRTSGFYQPDPFEETVVLADLSLTGYGSFTGVDGAVHTIVAELPYDGTNAADCEAYAEQAATDWYNWQLCDLDVTMPSVVEWEPTGAEDFVEWRWQIDRIVTRVVRGAFQTLLGGSWAGGPHSAGQPFGTPLVPVPGAVPVFGPGQQLTNTPIIVEQYTENDEPAVSVTIYQTPEYDTTTPAIQFVIEDDGAGPRQYVTHYPEGTAGPALYQTETAPDYFQQFVTVDGGGTTHQYTVEPDLIQQQFQIGGETVFQQVTQPSAGIIQFQTGNAAGTQGEIKQFTVDGTGDIDELRMQFQVDDATDPVQMQVTEDGGDSLMTLTGQWDGTGVTGAGFGAGSSSSTWTKYTKTYTDFSTAATSLTITVGAIAAGTYHRGFFVKHSAAFGGGSVVSAGLDLGRTGNQTDFFTIWDVFGAPSSTNIRRGIDEDYSNSAGYNITATLNVGGGNLNTLTTGSVDIWIETYVLP